METRDFFISYTKTDKEWALWAAYVLKKNGYTVYMQELDIKSANFLKKIETFLDNSHNLIALWSEEYSKSDYAMDEWRGAYNAVKTGEMNALIPILLAANDQVIPRFYRPILYANLFGKAQNAESEKILMDMVRDAVPRVNADTETADREDMYGGNMSFSRVNGNTETIDRDDTYDMLFSDIKPSDSLTPQNNISDFVLTHTVGKSEAKYGFIALGSSRNLGLGQEVSVQWGDGPVMRKRMHRSMGGRIDGLTKIYRDNGIQTGMLLRVSYDSARRLLTIEKA